MEQQEGLYRICTPRLCAGFVLREGKVIACAPVLRRRLAYWRKIAASIEADTSAELEKGTGQISRDFRISSCSKLG